MGRRANTYADVLRQLVRRENGCLEWTGPTDNDGYGHISIRDRMWLVHRLVWIHDRGPIPRGRKILHICDNPPCTEIRHLYVGTDWRNRRDADTRNRSATGERMGRLTNRRAQRLRIIRQRTGLSYYVLAEIFGVSYSTARKIALGLRYQ